MTKITYTYTDEAPALATHSFLPVIDAFTDAAGVEVETRDISLAARILAQFDDQLPEDQRVPDTLAELGDLVTRPEANVIKLPNISASEPQLKSAIRELQAAGYELPDYPEEPSTDDERDARARYDRAKGSAVNPVLRMGNSDRRAPAAVKQYARNHPHSMGEWSSDSRSHVATMDGGDFCHTETSVTVDDATTVRIVHTAADGTETVLKDGLELEPGEIFDAAVMRRSALLAFLQQQIADAREQGILFSVHLKATMMKVQDPIVFGHVVHTYYQQVWDAHGDTFDELGVVAPRRHGRTRVRHHGPARRPAAADPRRHRGDLRPRARAGAGRLQPRHHQPARAQRHHHRRVDAGDDPLVGPDVEP